ncbi:hypothetical protein BUALT_Bualt02G0200500 [Buddleja alternifolia]|uniref:Uncharacterized protein n=1 Tax=Buddleja alternifolia TaxID=168488 RepID=A0AAV6Y368_9LAMI|nr:hypothetical protein BUALT_Bualt02G0200500 [Buddleja alternifolia]
MEAIDETDAGTQVHCGLRDSLQPSAMQLALLTESFSECSVNSPFCGPLLPNSHAWCLAPFDPEGILRSVVSGKGPAQPKDATTTSCIPIFFMKQRPSVTFVVRYGVWICGFGEGEGG